MEANNIGNNRIEQNCNNKKTRTEYFEQRTTNVQRILNPTDQREVEREKKKSIRYLQQEQE